MVEPGGLEGDRPGLGIIAIAYIISIWAGLSTLNWLLEKFFSQIFIILVILFQSEILRLKMLDI